MGRATNGARARPRCFRIGQVYTIARRLTESGGVDAIRECIEGVRSVGHGNLKNGGQKGKHGGKPGGRHSAAGALERGRGQFGMSPPASSTSHAGDASGHGGQARKSLDKLPRYEYNVDRGSLLQAKRSARLRHGLTMPAVRHRS